MSDDPTTYKNNQGNLSIPDPVKAGKTFKGWSGTGLTGDTKKNLVIPKGSTENRTYTANWNN